MVYVEHREFNVQKYLLFSLNNENFLSRCKMLSPDCVGNYIVCYTQANIRP